MCTDKKLSLNKCETLNLQQKLQLKSDAIKLQAICSLICVWLCLEFLMQQYVQIFLEHSKYCFMTLQQPVYSYADR